MQLFAIIAKPQINANDTKVVKVVFQMPLTVATNSDVTFSFKVKTNCNEFKTISFTVKAVNSCTFTLVKNSTPSTITTLAKGRSYTYHYTLKNTSNDTATFSGANPIEYRFF